jgi:hypothetical protein
MYLTLNIECIKTFNNWFLYEIFNKAKSTHKMVRHAQGYSLNNIHFWNNK